jgi:DNA N-6-adenine-methyltransferase (Dam)
VDSGQPEGQPLTGSTVSVADEKTRLGELEAIVERGLASFVEVGNALLEIRDSQLYRESHSTFDSYCRERWGMERAHAYRQIQAAQVAQLVSPIGDIPRTESQARELAPLLDDPEMLRETWAEVVELHPAPTAADVREVVAVVHELRGQYGDKVTAAKVRAVVSDRLRSEQNVATIGSSASEEWYTPQRYIEVARNVLGVIDLDPASNANANATVRALVFYSADDDGLDQTWEGRVWLNPPYGNKTAQFVAKLREEYDAGNVTAAILLVSAYSTETRWFHPLLQRPVCFTDHRIDFKHPDGRGGSSNHGSAFVYLGNEESTFVREFSAFGTVTRPAA